MRLSISISVLMSLFTFAIACGGDDGATPESSADGSPLAAEATREWAGVRLTLSIDKEVYKVGETVKVRAAAENTRGEQLLFRPVAPGLPPIRLAVDTDIKGTMEFSGGRMEGGEGAGLAPGARVVREFEWDQQLTTYQTPVQAPEGTYELSAQVVVSPDETSRPDAVAAVVRFRLDGGEPLVSSAVAIETALFHDEVKRWFEGRPTEVVCADSNRGVFFIVDVDTPSATETFIELYESQVAEGKPICSPVTEGDTWRVIFSSREGPAPARISAFVDLHDGSFLRVEEGGPGGTPGS
jgi:hypothetical protein